MKKYENLIWKDVPYEVFEVYEIEIANIYVRICKRKNSEDNWSGTFELSHYDEDFNKSYYFKVQNDTVDQAKSCAIEYVFNFLKEKIKRYQSILNKYDK